MAQGSQQFTWKLFPGVERVCWSCGRELKIADVAEYRRFYSSPKARPKTQFLCVTCRDIKTEKLVQRTREQLGLGRKDPWPQK